MYIGAPAQPGSIMATIQDDSLRVTWVYSDPGNNIPFDEFLYIVRETVSNVIVKEDSIEPTSDSLTINLSDLRDSTLYNFELRGSNLLGSSPVGGQQFTTAGGEYMHACMHACVYTVQKQ